ncbi:MAG: HAMP domain-containing protein [Candidatus Eisenbacteria bacterium]|uniref:histidine kinase n=1 Tax=Eiseniibacteriota bacterium TaxID=2212470 RepID=A0A849SEK4_UNCEI|nr:HAMP domain-containing protein [Candidatus Eisenbacteria bacterium]
MSSLRARLIGVTILVAVVAVTVVALHTRQVVNTEFRRLERLAEPVPLEPVARAVSAMRSSGDEWAAVESLLAGHGRRLGRALVVVAPDGTVLASSAAPLRGARVLEEPGDVYRVEHGRSLEGAGSALMLELHSPPRLALAGVDSGARLLALPTPESSVEPPRPSIRVVERGLLTGALVAIALGVLLVWVLSAQVLGPIEALTAAARRMAAGDLSPRVTPRGRDEVSGLAASFNAMAEALAAAQASRRRLTRDVAHELRTPLTALRGQLEAVEDGLLPPNPATLRSLREEVARMSQLIEDLDRLAGAEDGSLRLELSDVPVREALESAAASFAAAAATAGVTLEADGADECVVRADPLRLGQVLRNLIANALAHTPPGGQIRLTALREADRVAIQVADSGDGISAEHVSHVFERFYRTDSARARASGGTGLGLAIVKHLIEAQGGVVSVASEPQRGARFTIELPAAPRTQA